MDRLCCPLLLVFNLWAPLACAADFAPVMIKGHPAHPTRILAKVGAASTADAHVSALTATRLAAVRDYPLVPGLLLLEVDTPAVAMSAQSGASPTPSSVTATAGSLIEKIDALRRSGLYEYVEPDYLVYPDAVPKDLAFTDGTLWGLRNTGQSSGVAGVDIDAGRAWDVTKGSNSVIVAVIDTGVRYTHRDLSSQMWRNPVEVAGNGLDDDGNGYIDDIFGINTVAGTGNPMDDDGHGTHVAGTIGAQANNGHPHVGVAWNVRLMALKFLAASGGGQTADAIECINYAIAKGARIINASWGGGSRSQALNDAIHAARLQGVLFVAAAGNEGADNDASPHYPANYDLENVISVAAINRTGARAYFSNTGVTTVDVGAPGVAIYSTTASSDTAYDSFQGTSMAAPHVSGAAVLVRAQFPNISVTDLRDRLIKTTTATPALQGNTVSGGRLNVYRALTAIPDGQLELEVTPGFGVTLFRGRATPLRVRVTDLVGVTSATVTASFAGSTTLTLLDDGVAPDAMANDGWYATTLTVPAGGTEFSVAVEAAAPGKASAHVDLVYPLRTAPPNDDFAARVVLSFPYGSVSGNSFGATKETGEPLLAGYEGGASVWWSWTAPMDTVAIFETAGSTFDTLLGVFTGGSVQALTEVGSNDDVAIGIRSSRVLVNAVAGTTYQIVVDGWLGSTGEIRLALSTTIPPVNDDFDDRLSLVGSSATASGNLINAGREPGEPAPPDPGMGGTVWWTWTAPSTGTATVEVSSSSYPGPVISIFAGNILAGLQRVPLRDDASGLARSTAVFLAEADTSYQIAVATAPRGVGAPLALSLALVAGPANDRFADRISLAGMVAAISGSALNATPEFGEPSHGPAPPGGSLWWTWTAPASGAALLDDAGGSFSSALAVYTGSQLSTLSRVAGNLDPGNGSPRRVRFDAVSGTTYQFAVESGLFGGGGVGWNLSLTDEPPNDDFANRIALAGTSINIEVDDTAASREAGEPPGGPSGGTTLWWSWTAPATGTATVSTMAFNRTVAVFEGQSLDTLSPVFNSAHDLSAASLCRFRAIAGTAYAIVVDTRSVALPGSYVLDLKLAGAPSNDRFAERTVLTGASVATSGTNYAATVEAGEPDIGYSGVGGRASAWWSWTAPTSGTVMITTTAPDYMPAIAVFAGAEFSTFMRVKSTQGADLGLGRFNFSAVAGTTYQIGVDGDYRSTAGFFFRLTLVDPPGNDHFDHRALLTGNIAQFTANNVGATPEPGEPAHAGAAAAASVWWTWTAASDGTVDVIITGADRAYSAVLYTGSSLSGLQTVPTISQTTQQTARLSFSANTGSNYHVVVDSADGGMGEFTIDLALRAPPPNDNFADRRVISGTNVIERAENLGASLESGEPFPVGYDGAAKSLWWTWTAPADGALIVSTAASEVPAFPGVFTGTALTSLNPIGTTSYQLSDGTTGRAFSVTAGTEYHFVIWTTLEATGKIALALTFLDPPANDNFAARATVPPGATVVTGRTLGASLESDESAVNATAQRSVWWSWTAPQTGTATIGVFSNAVTDHLRVYSGASLAALTPVFNNVSSANSKGFRAHVAAGTTYQIAVNSAANLSAWFQLRCAIAPASSNDQFADRLTMSGLSVLFEGSNVNATVEEHESLHHDGGIYNSVWWTWTAPTSGRAVIGAITRTFGTIAVYTGTALSTLQQVDTNRSTTPFAFDAVAGTTYQIAFDGTNGLVGDVAFDLQLVDAPPNDAFAAPSVIVGTSAVAAGTNLGASAESGEPAGSNGAIWWSWTAPANGRAILSARRSNILVFLDAYTGSTLTTLTRIARSEFGTKDDSTRIAFTATAGVTYRFAATGWNGTMGNIVLDLLLVDPPANDNFAARAILSGSTASTTGSNWGAQFESGEPTHQFYPASTSVWWSWTAPASGRAVIALDTEDFMPTLAVYVGDSLPALNRVVVRTGTSGAGVSLAFDAAGGTTYQIAVDGYAETMGDFVLSLQLITPPANDEVSNPSAIMGLPATVSGTNLGAVGEHELTGVRSAASVWWSWTAAADAVIAVSTAGSNFDTVLGVYLLKSGGSLDFFGANNDGLGGAGGSRVVFRATEGETYLFVVAGIDGATGNIVLTLNKVTPPPNDLVVDATPIAPDGVLAIGSTLDATSTSGGPDFGIVEGEPSIWWTFTPGFTGTVRVSATGTDFEVRTELFQRLGPSSWSLQATSLNGGVLEPGSFNAAVAAGNAYYIKASGLRGSTGTIQLRVTTSAPLAASIRTVPTEIGVDSSITLMTDVIGSGPFNYQWALNGENISGATSASLVLPSAQSFHAGLYSVRVSAADGYMTTEPTVLEVAEPPPSGARLTNLSTRAVALTGENVLIPGIVIAGDTPKRLLLRAIGPQLAAFGVAGAMPDPRMTLKRWNGSVFEDLATNNDWSLNANAAALAAATETVGAFALDAGGGDAALLVDLAPGQYTVVADDTAGASGVAMVELYDADTAATGATLSRLINLSNRGYVGHGADVMIPGFVISSEGAKTLLLRAVGPGLAQFGVAGLLADPKLTVFRAHPETGANELILANDNWGENSDAADITATATQVGAFELAPNSADAAFVVTLLPGVYTVHASGADGGTGVALVELYVVE